MDVSYYVEMALASNPLREPVLRAAIRALELPAGSQGLDAGCGIGLQTLLLAEAVGPAGQITGLDLFPEYLEIAEQRSAEAGRSAQVHFRVGDVRQLPFEDDQFDWAWSVDCVGYAPMDPLPAVKELARVVRPGGRVILLAWSSERLLPGYPLLEARLSGTPDGLAPFSASLPPESHFMRALGWFRAAGLEHGASQTLAGSVHAPLSDALRQALEALFEMRWPGVEAELAREERRAYERLCRPESADFILRHPDYAAFFTYTLFQGTVSQGPAESP